MYRVTRGIESAEGKRIEKGTASKADLLKLFKQAQVNYWLKTGVLVDKEAKKKKPAKKNKAGK